MKTEEKVPKSEILRVLIPKGQRAKWLLVAGVGVVDAIAESLAAIAVAALIASMTEASLSSFDLPLIGDVTEFLPGDSNAEQLRILAIATAVFFVLKAGLTLARSYIQSRVANRTGGHLASRLFRGYLSMPYSFHISHNSSELIRNASWAADEVVNTYLNPIAAILVQVSMLAFLLAVLVAAAPAVTGVTLGVLVPVTIIVVQSVRPTLRRLGVITKQTVKDSLNSLQQSLHGIRDVKVLGRERYFSAAFSKTRDDLAGARYKSTALGAVPSIAIETLVIVTIIGVIAISAGSGLEGATLPTLGLFAYAGLRMLPATSTLVAGVNKLRYGYASAETVARALAEIQANAERPPRTEGPPLPFTSSLTLDAVTFSYEPGTVTVQDISLTVRRGESVGIVGETGAGKSTLLDLILGLLRADSGKITVDGVDIHENIRSWHALIGLVPQTTYLLDDTVRRNIAYGMSDDEVDENAVRDAIRLAQLERFIDTLPKGLDTVVGERGIRLSGGQRQRVAIARALYRKPEVLVFDEGTASLDNLTEAELLKAIDDLRGEHTIITVAHRLTTVRNCDRILLLEDGKLTDEGTYEELQERNLTFRRMSS